MSKASREWKIFTKKENSKIKFWAYECYVKNKDAIYNAKDKVSLKDYQIMKRYFDRDRNESKKNNRDFEAEYNHKLKYQRAWNC